MARLAVMRLRDLLPKQDIPGPSELGRRLEISRQHAWLLWHGYVLPSAEMLQKLRSLGIPAEKLMELERAEPAARRGPKLKRPPQRKGKGRKPGGNT
jgi:transcriptional regulator with XRE-family HTH domain